MPAMRTARLVLRDWRDDDLDAFAALNADPKVMEHYPAALTRAESDAMAARIRARIREQDGWGLWAVEVPGESPFVGFVGLQHVPFEAHFTPAVEVGWRIAHAYWGRGYAPEAALASLDYGFGRLGLAEIISMTVPANVRSSRVMEKIGMKRDPSEDFDHPRLPEGHALRRHVLYRLRA